MLSAFPPLIRILTMQLRRDAKVIKVINITATSISFSNFLVNFDKKESKIQVTFNVQKQVFSENATVHNR